jgi:hypothetical protein
LREGLRQYLLPDSTTVDTTEFDNDDGSMPAINTQDQSKAIFDRLFGTAKTDSSQVPALRPDTIKTKKQLRQEKREEKRRQKELEELNKPKN